VESDAALVASEARPLQNCVLCGRGMPLRLPLSGEQGEHWACAHCDTSYFAVLIEDASPELLRNVRRPETGDPPPPPPPRQAGTVGRETRSWPARHDPRAGPDHESPVPPPHVPPHCLIETAVTRHLDGAIERGRILRFHPEGEPYARAIRRHGAVSPSMELARRIADNTERSAGQLAEMFIHLEAGRIADVESTRTISGQALSQAVEDMDLFVALGIDPPPDGYPSRHGLHVAMLAMSTGARMGWDRETLIELGAGCLLHDLGMLAIQQTSYRHGRFLSSEEFREIVKHPVKVFDLLEDQITRIPAASRMVAYQIHERFDGSGYPRGRAGAQIHPLARVAAVADVFVALVSPRPYRPPIPPYRAMETMLYEMQRGAYDPNAVRALLRAVSLFPLGTYVQLSDGRVAKSIRANGDSYDRPVIEIWQQQARKTPPEVVDLLRLPELKVVRALGRTPEGTAV